MAWAGAPFATPTDVMLLDSILRVMIDDGNRAFLYQPMKSWQIMDKLASVALRSAHLGDQVGLRLDDGTDNNYIEVNLRCSQASPTLWAVRTRRRAGGGAVTTQDGDDMHTDPGNVLRMWLDGTPFDEEDTWNVIPGLHTNMGFEGLMFKPLASLAANAFIPTRAGIIFDPPAEGELVALVDWFDIGRPWRWYNPDPWRNNLCVWGAYLAKGAASFEASLVDISGNGNDLTDPGGAATPTWDAGTGWSFDGVAQYLTTAFVPVNTQAQSMVIRFSGLANRAASPNICGMDEGANLDFGFDTLPANTTFNNGGSTNPAIADVAAVYGIAGAAAYQNGVAVGGAIGAWGGAPTLPVMIGAENTLAGAANFADVDVQALVIYDCTVPAFDMRRVSYAMAYTI